MSASSIMTHPAPSQPATHQVARLIVAWQHPETRHIHPIGRLEATRDGYGFAYLRNARQIDGFRPFVGFPDLERRYQSSWLFPLFAERVMDPRRPDHARFMQALDLPEDASPLEVLAASNGRRVGDTIQLFPEPRVADDGSTSCRFLVHGVRHVLRDDADGAHRLAALEAEDRLLLVDEPTNHVNPRAILTTDVDGGRLGWVPDMLLDYVHAVRDVAEPHVRVAHVNDSSAPPHLRILAELTGVVPTGYHPFSGPKWEPIASS